MKLSYCGCDPGYNKDCIEAHKLWLLAGLGATEEIRLQAKYLLEQHRLLADQIKEKVMGKLLVGCGSGREGQPYISVEVEQHMLILSRGGFYFPFYVEDEQVIISLIRRAVEEWEERYGGKDD